MPDAVPLWPATATKRLLDKGTDDARTELAKDPDAKRQRREHEEPTQREPSRGSGRKRSPGDDEAKRRAEVEAEKTLKRARELEERKVAKRASAIFVQELEESLDPATGTSSSAAAVMVAAEAVQFSALQQTHAVIHRAETTAEGC